MDQIEQFTQDYAAGKCLRRESDIEIPVVFHVLYNTAGQNISNTRIMEQLKVLNDDFARANADAVNTPSAFSAVNTRIQFCLATRAPDCSPTTGILRKYTPTTSFAYGTAMKHNGTNGDDAWPEGDYLNIWVCPLSGGILGFGTFPGTSLPGEDGIVLDYGTVGGPGSPGTAAPYHLGRTATHEVGHWLNLRHIWGDDGTACTGTDYCGDTPDQGGENYGCPTYVLTDGCSPSSPGVMFMNYMDYVDDNCMNAFTSDQSTRMHATLESVRASLFLSLGCSPGQTAVDLYMRDSPEDVGNEPNYDTGWVIWNSNDIWVRNAADGVPTHQNPIHGVTNYIYVRVFNKGCNTSSLGPTLTVNWTKTSTSSPWPSSWNGTTTFACGSNPVRGNFIASAPIPAIGPSGSYVFMFPWVPPTPANYTCMVPAGDADWHFCLLARIQNTSTYPFGMTTAEGTDAGTNARNNNNIIWKNLHIDPPTIATLVSNDYDDPTVFNLMYMVPDEELAEPITANGNITIELGPVLFDRWMAGGQEGKGIEVDQERPFTVRVTEPRAVIGNLLLQPKEDFVPIFRITFAEDLNKPLCTFRYHIVLQDYSTQAIIGGVEYEIHKPVCISPNAGDDQQICPGCTAILSASPRDETATYEWRDLKSGQIVGTGQTIEVTPQDRTTYQVTMRAENGCVDADDVVVDVIGGGALAWGKQAGGTPVTSLEAIPNPFSNSTQLKFTVAENCDVQVQVYDAIGRIVATLYEGPVKTGQVYQTEFQAKGLKQGTYFARLNLCGKDTRMVKLIHLD